MKKSLVKNIFSKIPSSMKVVFNGGEHDLKDPTAPFQIAFNKSIADQGPTHVLVIDVVTDANNKVENVDDMSERTLFKLEPVQYLQLKKPGIHHIVFVLLNKVDKDYQQFLLEERYSRYEHDLYLNSIQEMKMDHQICFSEIVVSVSEKFFAPEPKTKWQKAIYSWVNSWYRLEPTNQCKYRRRKIWAFTLKPILWFLGFIPRVILAPLFMILMFVIRIICFVCGLQPVSLFPNIKMMLKDFLLLYPLKGYADVFNIWEYWLGENDKKSGFYGFKILAIGKKRIYTPITLIGFIFYLTFILTYILIIYISFNESLSIINVCKALGLIILCSIFVSLFMVDLTLPTIKRSDEWHEKWSTDPFCKGKIIRNKVGWRLFFSLSGFAVLSFLITQIQIPKTNLVPFLTKISFSKILFSTGCTLITLYIFYLIIRFLLPLLNNIIKEINKEVILEKRDVRKQQHQEWLYKSFNMKSLPKEVKIKTMPKPSSLVHYFRVGFWFAKSKVCKPYARK